MRWTGDIHTLTSPTNNIVGTPWKRLLPRKIVKREASRPVLRHVHLAVQSQRANHSMIFWIMCEYFCPFPRATTITHDNELLAFSGGSQAIVDAKAPTLQETQVATQLDVESHWPS